MYCKNCGTQIPDDALFCPACGTKTANFPQEPAVEAPAPAEVKPEAEIPAAVSAAAVPSIETELDSILDREGTQEAAPEAVQPGEAQPEPVQPEEAQPAEAQPEPVQPKEAQPEPLQPDAVQPAEVQPEPVQPQPAQEAAPGVQSAPQPEPVRSAPQNTGYIPASEQARPETTYQSSYNQGVTPVRVQKKKKPWVAVIIILLVLAIGGYFAYPVISNQLNYNKAVKYYNSGDYAQALPLFEELADKEFKDSLDYEHKILYTQALDAYDSGNLSAAVPLFDRLAKEDYRDADVLLRDIFSIMIENIQNNRDVEKMIELNSQFKKVSYPGSEYVEDYADAFDLLNQGRYYDAYMLFDSIDSFEDSYDRAMSCVQETPSSGVIYSSGQSGNVDLVVEAPEWYDTYIKIYLDGTLCRTMFIRKGSSATAYSMPAGNYTMNVAYEGYLGYWFGPDDMFGDDGSYNKLLLDGSNYEVYLQSNYTYTLTLMAGEGNVGSTDAGREDI